MSVIPDLGTARIMNWGTYSYPQNIIFQPIKTYTGGCKHCGALNTFTENTKRWECWFCKAPFESKEKIQWVTAK